MTGFVHDVRYAMRQFRKSPGFAAVAVITLGLGIGANTAIFSVVNAVLLRPLPFRDADRVVRIWHVPPQTSFPGISTFSVSPANFLDWQSQNHVFELMAIYGYRDFTLTGGDKAEEVGASPVSAGFFETVGVKPLLGRALSPDEDQPGRSHVVVLSYRFWQEHFGGKRGVIGENITLDGANYLVAGVMPASFRFPADFAQMWTPMAWSGQERAVRGNHNYEVIARLKPGIDVKQAQAEMNTISTRLAEAYPADDKGWGAVVTPLHDDLVSDVRPACLVLMGAVGFILLIACVNVTNLSLARIFGRHKEVAIRIAIGASPARMMRQILVESAALALAGGVFGLAYAPFATHLIMAFLAGQLPASVAASIDTKVLVFTAAVAVFSGIIAGIAPAFALSRTNVNQALKQGLGRTDSDSGGNRTRKTLVVVEVSLSLVLLVGAGLMIRSFQLLREVNPGFGSHGVLTMTAAVSRAKFPGPLDEVSFFERVLDRVRALPGVVSAGVADDIPLEGGSHQPIAVEGRPVVAMSEQPEVDVRVVSAGYVNALRIPVLRGRDFDATDVAGRPPAILISASLARQFWPSEDPIGKHITLTFFPGMAREVVGVVGDVKFDGLAQSRPGAALYVPLDQITASKDQPWQSAPMTLVVHTALNPMNLVPAVTNAIHGVDRDVPVRDVQTMDEVVANSLSEQRFDLLLLGAFAVVALVLAGIGIYSVLSHSVRRRVQEIGIRLALGASLSDVLGMIVLEGMRPTLLGLAIGTGAALALAKVMSSLLYQVKPTDPATFLAVAVLLALVALLASMIPAYRAAKVDPMVALRYE